MRDASLHQHVHVERNATLKLRQLEQRFHHQLGVNRARSRFDHQSDVFCRFIAHICNQRQFLFVDQLGEPFNQTRFLHQPRNFGDDDHISAAAGVFLFPPRPHAKRAAAGVVGFGDRLGRVDDDAAGREIRALDVFEQRLAARLRIVDEEQRGVAQLGRIVRRDGRRHTHRDALRAVRQQIGKRRRQDHRFLTGAVIASAEVDGVFVDAVDQQARDFGEPRFGVAHGGGVIAVDISEVALPVHERIALREILREPHQCVVDRLIAVRVEIAHHVADDLG